MRTVADIMNREVLVARPRTPAESIVPLLHRYRVSCVPVVDSAHHPLGMITACALFGRTGTAHEVMTRPAPCIDSSTDIVDAARRIATEEIHHFVVVDAAGAAIGIVSALDVMRGLFGLPARHPDAFTHWDPNTGTAWTHDWPLDDEHATHAPDAPGVLALVQDRLGAPLAVEWVEACDNLRERVSALSHGSCSREVADLLHRGDVCFRAAEVHDEVDRERLARRMRSDLEHRPPPGAT
jgi:tRNA isopentenyl-2-thiomethyl-A-37 hydroxylase MiaE